MLRVSSVRRLARPSAVARSTCVRPDVRFAASATPSSSSSQKNAGKIWDNAELMTGTEKLRETTDAFEPDNLDGPFGTKESPVKVPSIFSSRAVGCVGGPENEHELTWHLVEAGKPTVCLHCGQYFLLIKKEFKSFHAEDSHAHDHHH